MTNRRRSQWLIPVALMLLTIVPAVGGIHRLLQLAGGAEVTPANVRFFQAPVPVVFHILVVIPYAVLGAFQVGSEFRRRHRRWHRTAGLVVAPLGLAAALTGLWMTLFYPWPEGDGELLYAIRLIFGSLMTLAILLALRAIRRRDFTSHGAWMLRGYAIGMGAGTQVLTHLPWVIAVGKPGELARAVLMGAGWVINLAIAESIIGRRRNASTSPPAPLPFAAAPAAPTGEESSSIGQQRLQTSRSGPART